MSKKGNEKPSAENPKAEGETPAKTSETREKVPAKPPTGNLMTFSHKPERGVKKSSKNEK